MESLDIVQLIENNPIVKLSSGYQGKLVNKIKETFTDTQQQLFVSSFYCYLNYDPNKDFVIKLNDVWKWIGYSRMDPAQRFLKKNFVKDVDYRVENFAPQVGGASSGVKKHGGQNKELITMTINTFKKFCMKSRTSKADEIHDYYLKLEEIIHGTVNEESEDLRMKLKNKGEESEDLKIKLKEKDEEKNTILEETLITQNPKNTLCIYYGLIDNVSTKNEKLIKFGRTNDLGRRLKEHKKVFLNFRLINVFKVSNHIEIENIIKSHDTLKKYRRSVIINHLNYTELLMYNNELDTCTIDDLIKKIIKENDLLFLP